jgi:hypothetical protein
MSAAELLRELAERTAHAPQPPGSGSYHYVWTSGVYLLSKTFLSRSGESTTTGSVEPSEREQWIAPDGSGRLEVTRGGELVRPTGDFGPGELAAIFIDAADDASLTAELARLSTRTSARAIIKRFEQVWSSQVVPPALQRLLLRNLAECPDLAPVENGVTYLDANRKRRHLLTFDPETGALVSTETTALEGADVPVSVPAVTSRTTWLLSGYCDATGVKPRAAH